MAEEQIDFGDDEYGGAQKIQYQGSGTIPALADVEMMGDDDEYDDLYNDVNVGEGFLQLQRPEAPAQPAGMDSTGFQAHKNEVPEPRDEPGDSQGQNISRISVQGKYANVNVGYREPEVQPAVNRPEIGSGSYPSGSTNSHGGGVMEMNPDNQVKDMGFQGITSTSSKVGTGPSGVPQKSSNNPAQSLN